MKTKLLPILMILMLACLSATGPKSNATIGKIGDRTFTYDEYNRILENYFNHHSGGKSQTLSPEEKARLNNQCWEEQIGRYIYDTEIKRRKLRITDAELERETLRNPPEAIKQIADLQTNNRFDPDKLRLALETNPDFKRNALDFVKQTYQYKKLFEAIRSAVKADADSVRREWTLQNDTADARIIHFDYNRLTNILASDDEIREYYETNIADYRKENGRTYRYFRFSKSPSPQDSLFTKNLADSLYVNLKEGGDFAEAAQQYSKDPGSALRG
ncbi:MAG: SurA N-terminal domain-containing protein, partial [Candidatus Cloacimonadaceae bacterium]|nr:SurA N-terminal domain-containing protein [Candidatus Cloacimonadaceae bacterium]